MKLEKIADAIVNFQIRFSVYFIVSFILITIMLVPGIPRLVDNVEPSLEKVLPQDIEEIKTMNYMRGQFGADMTYLLIYTEPPVYDARNPDFIMYLNTVTEKLRERDLVLETQSIADIVIQDNFIPEKEAIEEIIKNSPESKNFINHDYSFAVIRLRTDTGASAEAINTLMQDIEDDMQSLETENPGSYYEITGFNAIDKATFSVIMSDFAKITLVSMILIMVVVYFTFRSLAKGMLPMVVVMVALLWTMGLVGYLGMTITVVTMVAAAMIMGLGIDFGIHVVNNYFELKKSYNPNKSLKETMRELLRAMLGASLTTTAGFLALLFGVLPAMKTLAVVLAIGIITTLIGAVMLLPVLVYQYDKRTTEDTK